MHFTYCPHCGEKLVQKEIGDEGKMPYCKNCEIPLWDSFTTCVICAVVNEQKEIALLRQNYVSADSYGLRGRCDEDGGVSGENSSKRSGGGNRTKARRSHS